MLQGARTPRVAALRIALAYLVVGLIYIRFSDAILTALMGEATLGKYSWVQTAKGWAFILITAVLLYYLIRRTFMAVRASAEARRQTEQRTQLLVERVRDYAIFTLDAAGNVTSWNRGAQQITDWPEADVLGKHVSIFYPPADASAGAPARDLAAAAESGWIDQDEVLRVRQDGSEFWAAAHFTTLREEGGQPGGFLCVWHDVTERRRARDALQEAHQMLWSIVEASPLPIITIDAADHVSGWNPAAERLFGWKAEEVIGKLCPSVPESERADYHLHVLKQLRGEAIQGAEIVRQGKDGRRLQLSLWTAPLTDASGKIVGGMGVFADLTERRRAEEQVRQLNETLERRVEQRTARLEEANEELQAFSYTVSHDLRIPLRSLQQLARDLVEKTGDTLPEEPRSDAMRIVGAAARMERQIEDLLEFSRVSRSELKTEPISVVLVVHELLGRLERDPAFRAARVVVREPLGWVVGHRLTLQQVILNLLTNAITFVRPGVRPTVTIHGEERDGRVRLCVEDNGIGIDADDRERIFHVFERLPAAEGYPGIGVGLTVARRGVERMGGKISFESSASGGTVFHVDLPKPQRA